MGISAFSQHALASAFASCHQSRVRFVPLLVLVSLTLAAPLFAQQQERKLEERITRPNKDLTFDTRQASFGGGRSFGTKDARSKSFGFAQKYSPKEFRSKEFAGSKAAWMGDFKFSTNQANTRGKYEVPNATRQVDAKTTPVADAREAGKGMPTREFAKSNRPYLGPEAEKVHKPIAPGEQPVGWTGTLKPMTIDDVRELLNKNK